ncbi:hypothetical protein acdb102_15420 [Acidothermaceae bacterium B102]|nr:hypothetical protein acdb102_15420 [Acidothermaceae bacterium B102]
MAQPGPKGAAIAAGEPLAIMLVDGIAAAEVAMAAAEVAAAAAAEVAGAAAAVPEPLLLPQAARDRPRKPVVTSAARERVRVLFMVVPFGLGAGSGRCRVRAGGAGLQATVTSSSCCPVAPSG